MLVLQMVLISVPNQKIGCMMSSVQVCVKLTATVLTTFYTFVKTFVFLEQTINEGSLLYATLFNCCFQNLQLRLNTAYLFYISYFVIHIYIYMQTIQSIK